MTQHLLDHQGETRTGIFDTVIQADRAISRLLAAGFSEARAGSGLSATFKDHFHSEVLDTKGPTPGPDGAIATGGLGATLGGLVLLATVATGGAAGVMGAAVLVGGGALAGGFSNLIISKGYEDEAEDDDYKPTIENGKIVVGVELQGEDRADRLAEARRPSWRPREPRFDPGGRADAFLWSQVTSPTRCFFNLSKPRFATTLTSLDRTDMTKHNSENEGSKLRDHTHQPYHF